MEVFDEGTINRLLADVVMTEVKGEFCPASGSQTCDCWVWKGSHTPKGVPRFYLGRNNVSAIRVMWQYIYNVADTRSLPRFRTCPHQLSCINPDHTVRAPGSGNIISMDRRVRCHRGHALNNITSSVNSSGVVCLLCEEEDRTRPLRRSKKDTWKQRARELVDEVWGDRPIGRSEKTKKKTTKKRTHHSKEAPVNLPAPYFERAVHYLELEGEVQLGINPTDLRKVRKQFYALSPEIEVSSTYDTETYTLTVRKIN